MHISSALTLVRRAPAQSDTPGAQGNAQGNAQGCGELRSVPSQTPEQTGTTRARVWSALPGGILLAILVLLGALLPVVF